MIRVLLVDDHAILRDGIRSLLSLEPDIEVVGDASSGEEAVLRAAALKPDVIVMDIVMPGQNGIEATRAILRQQPTCKVLGLSMYGEEEYIHSLLNAGAMGYIVKSAAGQELVKAIREVFAGRTFLEPSKAVTMIQRYMQGSRGQEPTDSKDGLTPREREVLALIASGMSTRQAAQSLGLKPKTVDVHRTNIMRKLDMHNVAELVHYAIRHRIIATGPGTGT